MAKNDAATKADLDKVTDDITKVITDFADQVGQRFDGVEQQIQLNRDEIKANYEAIKSNRDDIRKILGNLDHIERQLETDGQERLVAGHQLQRLHDWAVEAGKKLGVEFKSH